MGWKDSHAEANSRSTAGGPRKKGTLRPRTGRSGESNDSVRGCVRTLWSGAPTAPMPAAMTYDKDDPNAGWGSWASARSSTTAKPAATSSIAVTDSATCGGADKLQPSVPGGPSATSSAQTDQSRKDIGPVVPALADASGYALGGASLAPARRSRAPGGGPPESAAPRWKVAARARSARSATAAMSTKRPNPAAFGLLLPGGAAGADSRRSRSERGRRPSVDAGPRGHGERPLRAVEQDPVSDGRRRARRQQRVNKPAGAGGEG